MTARTALVLLLVGCSGDGLTGKAPADAILDARFDNPTGTDCSVAGSVIGVGKFADDPIGVYDKSKGDRGVYHIACTVHDNGNQTLQVTGTIQADDRLLFAVSGKFPSSTNANGFTVESASLSNGQTDDLALFTQADNGCVVLYTTAEQGAMRGRVWGVITCPAATKDATRGGKAAGTCTTIAQFRFENCAP